MTKKVKSVRFTNEQLQKIEDSGLTVSEYVSRAVDYYYFYINNPYNNYLLDELENWIKIKKCNTDVLPANTNVISENTNVLPANTNVSTGNTKNEITKKCNTDVIQKTLENELTTIQKLLNNPDNLNSLPDFYLKKISKEYALSKSTIQSWVSENRDELKNGEI